MSVRVNKITVDIDAHIVSLYKSNQLLATIDIDDLGIENLDSVSVKAQQLYVRDMIINLLDNGAIDGYYYEPKSESMSVKYDNSSFIAKAKEYVQNTIGDDYKFILMQDEDIQAERYKDNFIKNASGAFKLSLIDHNISVRLYCEIKSGQMCRPRQIGYNNEILSFNITTIRKIIKEHEMK